MIINIHLASTYNNCIVRIQVFKFAEYRSLMTKFIMRQVGSPTTRPFYIYFFVPFCLLPSTPLLPNYWHDIKWVLLRLIFCMDMDNAYQAIANKLMSLACQDAKVQSDLLTTVEACYRCNISRPLGPLH